MHLETKSPIDYDGPERSAFSVKEMTDAGMFVGYASVFGKRDLQDEIVEAGAFARSLERASKDYRGGKFPLLWQHDQGEPIGSFEAEEDGKGLKIKGTLLLDISRGKDAYSLLKSGTINGLSIGYRVVKDELDRDNGTRKLKEVDLWETSVVTFPANPHARVRSVKGVLPFAPLAFAPDWHKWDSAGARERVLAYRVSGKSIKSAFLAGDVDCDDYRLQIADVVDGQLRIVPEALYRATAIALGAKSSERIADAERDAVLDNLARHYRKLGRIPPWVGMKNYGDLIRSVSDLISYADPDVVAPLRAKLSDELNLSSNEPFNWPDFSLEPEEDSVSELKRMAEELKGSLGDLISKK